MLLQAARYSWAVAAASACSYCGCLKAQVSCWLVCIVRCVDVMACWWLRAANWVSECCTCEWDCFPHGHRCTDKPCCLGSRSVILVEYTFKAIAWCSLCDIAPCQSVLPVSCAQGVGGFSLTAGRLETVWGQKATHNWPLVLDASNIDPARVRSRRGGDFTSGGVTCKACASSRCVAHCRPFCPLLPPAVHTRTQVCCSFLSLVSPCCTHWGGFADD